VLYPWTAVVEDTIAFCYCLPWKWTPSTNYFLNLLLKRVTAKLVLTLAVEWECGPPQNCSMLKVLIRNLTMLTVYSIYKAMKQCFYPKKRSKNKSNYNRLLYQKILVNLNILGRKWLLMWLSHLSVLLPHCDGPKASVTFHTVGCSQHKFLVYLKFKNWVLDSFREYNLPI
jgi:hypothetical protein